MVPFYPDLLVLFFWLPLAIWLHLVLNHLIVPSGRSPLGLQVELVALMAA